MQVGVIQSAIRQTAFAVAVGVNLLIAPKVPAQAIAPAAIPSPPPAHATMGATAEVERISVTGSNIPTAEAVGPHPVDASPPAEIEQLRTRSATHPQTFLPQGSGS